MAMTVLEAMASGCAVIASTEPLANAALLAEGRGIAVPAGDVAQTSDALLLLLDDVPLCRSMGMAAREYIRVNHNPVAFRDVLLRVLGEAPAHEPAQQARAEQSRVGQSLAPTAFFQGESDNRS